jgi:hypothetical protein
MPALSFRCEAYSPKIHPLLAPSIALAIMLGVRSDGFRRGTAGGFDREENPGAELRRKRDLRSAFVRFFVWQFQN